MERKAHRKCSRSIPVDVDRRVARKIVGYVLGRMHPALHQRPVAIRSEGWVELMFGSSRVSENDCETSDSAAEKPPTTSEGSRNQTTESME